MNKLGEELGIAEAWTRADVLVYDEDFDEFVVPGELDEVPQPSARVQIILKETSTPRAAVAAAAAAEPTAAVAAVAVATAGEPEAAEDGSELDEDELERLESLRDECAALRSPLAAPPPRTLRALPPRHRRGDLSCPHFMARARAAT